MHNNLTSISVKTNIFEGPLELLLDLVEKRKLLINDISLADVTDEYMQQVSLRQELSLPNTAQFITLAATLLLVKSKSLLPILDLSAEEEQSIEDLEERLKLYQIIRDAGEPLRNQFGKETLFSPQFNFPAISIFLPDSYCTLSALQSAIFDVITDLPIKETPNKATVKVTVSLEEMIAKLEDRIRQNIQIRFSDINQGEAEKKVIIVSFLALLELFKRGNLILVQNNRYSDIEIELDQEVTPRYY